MLDRSSSEFKYCDNIWVKPLPIQTVDKCLLLTKVVSVEFISDCVLKLHLFPIYDHSVTGFLPLMEIDVTRKGNSRHGRYREII